MTNWLTYPKLVPLTKNFNFHIISAILMRTSSRHFDEKKRNIVKKSHFFSWAQLVQNFLPPCLCQTFFCCGCWLSKQKRRNFLFHVSLTIFLPFIVWTSLLHWFGVQTHCRPHTRMGRLQPEWFNLSIHYPSLERKF